MPSNMNLHSIHGESRMPKFNKTTNPPISGEIRSSEDVGEGWFNKNWRLVSLLAIILVAFLMRFVFAFGISAGDNYALSGGTSATNHLHVIESILNGTFSINDLALNYPNGSLNVSPVAFDFLIAGLAGIGTLLGASTTVAASAALAWSAPIFAALTCYPVYLVGKKMYKDDEKVGLLAALFYAFFGLLIMETVFSNGTEYAFIGLVFAFMTYFLVSAVKAIDVPVVDGPKFFQTNSAVKYAVIAGLLFGVITLSWNKFNCILLLLIFLAVVQVLIDRYLARDIIPSAKIYGIVIWIGVIIAALYYIPSGLWTQVFSGPFVTAIIVTVLVAIYTLTANKPWTLMLPVTLLIAAVIFVVMYFAVPEIFDAVVNGNSIYEGSLMNSLVMSVHTSISKMASFYGWVTLWTPLFVFGYMVYKFREMIASRTSMFLMFWMFGMFSMGWLVADDAFMAGVAFAVASAIFVMLLLRKVDLISYFKGLRGMGFKAGVKKFFTPVPFVTLILLVGLILAPNVTYAFDAATPTNSEDSEDYFGGLGYSIMTSENNSLYKLWDAYDGETKDGALVTWMGHSSDAAALGGFNVVSDTIGGGSSASSNILLADSSAGSIASMAIRLILSEGVDKFKNDLNAAGLGDVIKYFEDPSLAVKEVNDNPKTYAGVNMDLTDENAIYLVVSEYMTNNLTESQITNFYDAVCKTSDKKISYVMVNGGMFPLYYGDNNNFSTIAYFNDYVIDGNSAASKYFSYNSYTKYATYTDALYDTFMWKAMFGPSAADVGETSAIAYLEKLASSDGTVKPIPGFGLSNFSVDYWHVQYAPEVEEGEEKDWKDMDAYEAMELQIKEGGTINYLSSVVLMKYNTSGVEEYKGTINYESVDGVKAAAGIQVAVFQKYDKDPSGKTDYVQYSTAFTNDKGEYSILVPTDGEYYITFSAGTKKMTGGMKIATFDSTSDIPTAGFTIEETNVSGIVFTDENNVYDRNIVVKVVGQASGYEAQSEIANGKFTINNLIPDVYNTIVYSSTGDIITTATLKVNQGENVGAQITLKAGKITITVEDEFGQPVESGVVSATSADSSEVILADVENGKAVLQVYSTKDGTKHTIKPADGRVTLEPTVVTVKEGSSKSATITVYDSKELSISGAPDSTVIIMAPGYTTVAKGNVASVPDTIAGTTEKYTAYAVYGNDVYMGVSDGNSVNMVKSAGNTVEGILKGTNGKVTDGTVIFYGADGSTITTVADEEGVFKAILPEGEYTMNAYNSGTKDVAVMTVDVDGDKDLKEVNMKDGRKVTLSLLYSTNTSKSSRGLTQVEVANKFTYDDKEYVLRQMTDADGKAAFYIPDNVESKYVLNKIDNKAFFMMADEITMPSGTSDSSKTHKLAGSPKKDLDEDEVDKKYMKNVSVSVSSKYTVDIKLYGDSSVKYTLNSTPQEVRAGQYTATINGEDGYYYDGKIIIEPGFSGELHIDVVEVSKVTVNAGEKANINVIAIENDDGKKGSYTEGEEDNVFYLQKGFDYYFKATENQKGDDAKDLIAYASVSNLSSPLSIDLTKTYEECTITGYVGVVADGTLEVKMADATLPIEIDNGKFTMKVPKGVKLSLSATVKSVAGGMVSEYSGSVDVAADKVVDEAIVNFYIGTDTYEPESTIVSGSDFVFSEGKGELTVSIKNEGKYDTTYILESGSEWQLNTTYSLTVKAGETGKITVHGIYDENVVGAGDSEFSVNVTDVLGKSVGSVLVDPKMVPAVTNKGAEVSVAGMEGASSDAVNSAEYKYAITIDNKDNYLKHATINVDVDAEGWLVMVSDSGEMQISPNGKTFDVYGYGKTVIYVKIMNTSSKGPTDVPDAKISVVLDKGDVTTSDDSKVTISGNTASATVSAQEFDLTLSDEITAENENVSMSPDKVPGIFWILTALSIITLLFIVWAGMKRGVFTRKN